jgi:hypothetical protein
MNLKLGILSKVRGKQIDGAEGLFLISTFRMRTSVVAGHTFNRWNHLTLIVFIEAEIFLVDFCGHPHHAACDIFFGFFVAGKIQVMTCTVFRRGMAEITFYTQCHFEIIHDLIQVFHTDVLRQDFQVLELVLFRRFGRCDSDRKEKTDHDDNEGLFSEDHKPEFVTKLIKFREIASCFSLFCTPRYEKRGGHRVHFYHPAD